MKNKEWKILEADSSLVSEISEKFQIPRVIAKVLVIRGITTDEQINKFFAKDSSDFYSPFLLNDMEKAINRILLAKLDRERVVIYGDYDVDGMTSTSLLYLFFKEIGLDVSYYIPNRFEEGYGINADAVRSLKEEGYGLMISVDTGISAIAEVELAGELGLDVIITDHHECKEVLPPALAVINPMRKDGTYPFKYLAGVGVAFKLACAVNERLKKDEQIDIFKYLEIVAIGTIADLVKLESENRLFVRLAFLTMKNSKNNGIKALFDVADLGNRKLSAGTVGFQIAPRLNAAGRLKSATMGVELFIAENYERAYKLASDLDDLNTDRKNIEKTIYDEAVSQIEDNADISTSDILVVAAEGWNKGVVGIVASRLVEKYYKPVVILSIDGDMASGSARSVDGFSIYDALNSVNDIFTKFGGHSMAAGMSLEVSRIDELRTRLRDYGAKNLDSNLITPKVYIDDEINIDNINTRYISEIRTLEPFGIGNREPVFAISGKLNKIFFMGAEKQHIKLGIGGIDAVGFNMAEIGNLLNTGQEVMVAGTLDNNVWNGNSTPTMYIKDVKLDPFMLESIKEAIDFHMTVNYFEERVDFISDENMCRCFYKILYDLEKQMCDRMYYTSLVYKHNIRISHALIMLEIFSELGIVDYELDEFYLKFTLIKGKKVELRASKLYNCYLKA